jgi:hypothetical protein
MVRVAIYPVLAMAAYFVRATGDHGVPAWALLRPTAFVLLAIAIALLLVRRWGHPAALAVAIVASILTGALVFAIVLLSAAVIRTALGLWFRRWRPAWGDVTAALNVYAIVLLVLAMVPVLTNEEFRLASSDEVARGPGNGPNMYVFLLDGYPRSDTLAQWGHDNSQFLEQLQALGFEVADDSHSNYTKTWLTLASMADFRHISWNSVLGSNPSVASEPVQLRRLSEIFNEARAWTVLRQHGYEIVASETAFPNLTLYTADRVIGSWAPNAFEIDLLRYSPLSRLDVVRDWLDETHRNRTRFQLESVPVERANQPVFVWTHVLSPHAPTVFGKAGEPRGHPCYPLECTYFDPAASSAGLAADELGALIGDQVSHLNSLLVPAIQRIVDSDPQAVIVAMSDHGSRAAGLTDESFANFFAARTPNRAHLFPEDAAASTTLAVLLNAYLDAGVAVPDPDMQYATVNTTLELERWPR